MRAKDLTALFFLLIGCGTADEAPVDEGGHAIIGGDIDTGDPSVVALYAQVPGSSGGFLCTGSVIAPKVVLTAAHCVSPQEAGANARFVVLTSPDISRRGGQQLAVQAVHPNPQWKPQNLQAGHDEGIVILKEPTSLKPLPINRLNLANLTSNASSGMAAPLRLVGYGLDDGYAQTGSGIKRQVLTKLRSVTAGLLRVGDSQRGTCNGDSGGPAFMNIGGVESIVGVTSYGNSTCSDGGYDARIDVDLAFIDQYLRGTCTPACDGRSCGGDGCGGTCGACAGSGDQCSSEGRCVPAATTCIANGAEQEPNDSLLQANPLCGGGTARGSIAAPDDQDWFGFTVAADSRYDARLTPATSDAALRVYKVSATGRLSFIGDGPTVSRHSDAGGSYLARITGAGATKAPYTLSVTTSH